MYTMSLLKLQTIACKVPKFRNVYSSLQCSIKYCTRPLSQKLDKDDSEQQELNRPMKYLSSPAYKWQAKYTRLGSSESRLWYEPYVILTSIVVFMVYFTILREENEVDNTLRTSLYDRIEGLEEQQLRIVYRYNLDNGLETDSIMKRLKELEAAKERKNE